MKKPISINSAIAGLFEQKPISNELALHLLTSWISNLETTERRIDHALLGIVAFVLGFLALDTGILMKITFQGAELQRTGLVLCIVPIVLSYLYYRYLTQISFAHDLRTAISVLYKKLHEPIYSGGLDLLSHIPSVRNLEAYDSVFAPSKLKVFHERTTDTVTIVLVFCPIAALIYLLFRLMNYPEVSLTVWVITVVVSCIFVSRAWLFGLRKEHDDAFAIRK